MATKKDKNTVAEENKTGLVQDWAKEKGAESAERRAKGGEDVTISLTNKTLVEFTADFGKFLKKGDTMEISDQALEIYTKKGVIKKL